jgi:hypothetical protein
MQFPAWSIFSSRLVYQSGGHTQPYTHKFLGNIADISTCPKDNLIGLVFAAQLTISRNITPNRRNDFLDSTRDRAVPVATPPIASSVF